MTELTKSQRDLLQELRDYGSRPMVASNRSVVNALLRKGLIEKVKVAEGSTASSFRVKLTEAGAEAAMNAG